MVVEIIAGARGRSDRCGDAVIDAGHAGMDVGGTPGGRKMSLPGQAPCPKRTNAKTLGGKGDPNTKQPFLKKILQVSGSAGASTLICLMGVSRGAAPNENAAINV